MFVMVGSKKSKRLAFLVGELLEYSQGGSVKKITIQEIAGILGVASSVKPKPRAVTTKQSGRRVAATSVRAGGGCTSPVLAGAG